jgi:DNA-damage-inducible protein J
MTDEIAKDGRGLEPRVPSEKTARALAQAREIRSRFYSIDALFDELDREDEADKPASTA